MKTLYCAARFERTYDISSFEKENTYILSPLHELWGKFLQVVNVLNGRSAPFFLNPSYIQWIMHQRITIKLYTVFKHFFLIVGHLNGERDEKYINLMRLKKDANMRESAGYLKETRGKYQ